MLDPKQFLKRAKNEIKLKTNLVFAGCYYSLIRRKPERPQVGRKRAREQIVGHREKRELGERANEAGRPRPVELVVSEVERANLRRETEADERAQTRVVRARAVLKRQRQQIVGKINGLNACHGIEGGIYRACDLSRQRENILREDKLNSFTSLESDGSARHGEQTRGS